jgi:small subunit ribosomal protein S21
LTFQVSLSADQKGNYLFVQLREGESQEHLLTRFRQTMQRDGILREVKRRRHFVSKSEARRLARAKAVRRARKRADRAQSSNGRRPR